MQRLSRDHDPDHDRPDRSPTLLVALPDAEWVPRIALYGLRKGLNIVAMHSAEEVWDEFTFHAARPTIIVSDNSPDGHENLLSIMAVAAANREPVPPAILRLAGGPAALGCFAPFVARRPIKVFADTAPIEAVERALGDFGKYFFSAEALSDHRAPAQGFAHGAHRQCLSVRHKYVPAPHL